MRNGEVPWLPRLLQALDLRRTDRCLLLAPPDVATARAIAFAGGRKGELTVAVERRALGVAIAAALPTAEVAVTALTPDLALGAFDAVVWCEVGPVPESLASVLALLARSLRPGGRFVVDLPAEAPWPELAEAAADARATATLEALAAACGPSAESLAASLRERSLRRVEPLLGTHLCAFATPFEAALDLGERLHLPENERQSVALALAHRRQSTGPLEVRAMRSCCAGMR